MRISLAKTDLGRAVVKGSQISKAVTTLLTIKIREDTKRFVPFEQGALRGSAQTLSRPEDGVLVYGGEASAYVRPQYYGLPNKRTAGTVSRWFEASKAANMRSWEKAAQEIAKGVK